MDRASVRCSRRRLLRGAGVLAALLAWPSGAAALSQAPRELIDLAYQDGPDADPRHRLDLYLPARAEAPLVVFVHGGAWSSGDKGLYGWLGRGWAARGVAVAALNYRLSPVVQHPAHARDVASATAWLARHAAGHGLTPRGLYLMGHSAGAHLVALVALDRAYLDAAGIGAGVVSGVIPIAGSPYDLDARAAEYPWARLLFSAAFGADPAGWERAAPLRYARADAPPFLIVHGADDRLSPPAQSRLLADALQASGASAELLELPGRDHVSILQGLLDADDPVTRAIWTFVDAP